jgi:hypothetical protein
MDPIESIEQAKDAASLLSIYEKRLTAYTKAREELQNFNTRMDEDAYENLHGVMTDAINEVRDQISDAQAVLNEWAYETGNARYVQQVGADRAAAFARAM